MGYAYFNRAKRAEMDKAVAAYRAIKAKHDRNPPPGFPTHDTSPERLAVMAKQLRTETDRLNKAKAAAERALELGVDFYSTSLGLLARPINTRKWKQIWLPVIADFDRLISENTLKLAATEIGFEDAGEQAHAVFAGRDWGVKVGADLGELPDVITEAFGMSAWLESPTEDDNDDVVPVVAVEFVSGTRQFLITQDETGTFGLAWEGQELGSWGSAGDLKELMVTIAAVLSEASRTGSPSP